MKARNRGFALIEVMAAIMIIGVTLLVLLQIRNQALQAFLTAGDQHTGAWLAELKMMELISQDLPDPNDNETWELTGSGDFAEFDDRSNELNRPYNKDWDDRYDFSRFEYEWKKEVVFIGPDFIGSQYELEDWEEPTDDHGESLGIEDPREKPAVRVVRVTLTVFLPEKAKTESSSSGGQGGTSQQTVDGRPAIRIVTYVDPNTLFTAAEEESTAATDGTGNNTGNSTGNNNGNNTGNNTGNGG